MPDHQERSRQRGNDHDGLIDSGDPTLMSNDGVILHKHDEFPHRHVQHHHHHPVFSPPLVDESTPLLKAPHARSVSFRWCVLALSVLLPFGGHVVKSSLSPLANDILSDEQFALTHAQFGALQSALSLPNLLVPIVGGMILDSSSSARGTLAFLAIALIGHAGFTLACSYKSFTAAIIMRALFGLGQGSTVVAQSRIAAHYFFGRELVFAVALCESVHNISGWLARITVVPIARMSGSYVYSLWAGVAVCLLSLIAGIVLVWFAPDEVALDESYDGLKKLTCHVQHHAAVQSSSPLASPRLPSPADTSTEGTSLFYFLSTSPLSLSFALLCVIHLLTSNYSHLFDYVSANLLHSRYDYDIRQSALLSSLSSFTAIFLCPIASLLIDRTGYKMYVVTVCATSAAAAYMLLAAQITTPIIPLLMLTLSASFIPTILRSAVVDIISVRAYGTAYGTYEVMESIGAVIGHVLVGFIVDKTQSYTIDLVVFAIMAAAAALLTTTLSIIDARYGGTLNSSTSQQRVKAIVEEEHEHQQLTTMRPRANSQEEIDENEHAFF